MGSCALGGVRFRAIRAPVRSSIRNSRLDCGRDRDLRVIAGRFEGSVAFEQRGVKFIGPLQRRAQHRRTHAMEIAPFRIENQQALRGKNLGVELGESLREGAARLVGGGQCVHGVGGAEQFPCLIDEWSDRLVEHHAAHGHRDRRRRFVDKFLQLAARRKRDVIDLGEVVVFGREPENRRMGSARCGCLPCARQRPSPP